MINRQNADQPLQGQQQPNTSVLEFFRLGLLAICMLLAGPANAILTIEVNKGFESGIPIAIVPFALEGGLNDVAHMPADIIESDLNSSGKFDPVPRDTFLSQPHDLNSVQFKDWRLLKAESLVVGRIVNIGNGQLEVRFRLIDVFGEQQLAGQKFIVPENRLRKVSHQISDIIYEKLTGIRGAFDTRIAYVTVEGQEPDRKFLLQVSDSDGYDPRTVLQSDEPILSPAWSPDGSWLAYVSFEKQRPNIYIQNVWSGERELISEYPGINSAPAWSPDGQSLALTLSKDGNPEIYVYNRNNKALRRMTRHSAIDTEPDWSPDGRSIVFSSGRSGAPQVFQVPASGGEARRLTFDGSYNAGPVFSPDGQSIALITDQGNGFRVGLYSVQDRHITELTETTRDESPSFAPNGEMIIYATQIGGRNVLSAVSRDGNVQQTLRFQQGSVREPAWSPFNR